MIQHPDIKDIVQRDPRFAYEAYEFIFDALNHSQHLLGYSANDNNSEGNCHRQHVTGAQLLYGLCDYARQEFGLLAKVVFHHWGIYRTDDIGEIVYNLIDVGMLSKTNEDHKSDFHDLFNLDRALSESIAIETHELAWSKRGTT